MAGIGGNDIVCRDERFGQVLIETEVEIENRMVESFPRIVDVGRGRFLDVVIIPVTCGSE